MIYLFIFQKNYFIFMTKKFYSKNSKLIFKLNYISVIFKLNTLVFKLQVDYLMYQNYLKVNFIKKSNVVINN